MSTPSRLGDAPLHCLPSGLLLRTQAYLLSFLRFAIGGSLGLLCGPLLFAAHASFLFGPIPLGLSLLLEPIPLGLSLILQTLLVQLPLLSSLLPEPLSLGFPLIFQTLFVEFSLLASCGTQALPLKALLLLCLLPCGGPLLLFSFAGLDLLRLAGLLLLLEALLLCLALYLHLRRRRRFFRPEPGCLGLPGLGTALPLLFSPQG